ncbi:MAG: adenylosuccinate lyase, partial [Bryocella sp.]
LAESGMSREDAYRLVQSHAMDAWKNDKQFRTLIENDAEISKRLGAEKISAAFDVTRQLTNIDDVFARVLAEG